MDFVVVLNGVGDVHDDKDIRNVAQKTFLSRHFPRAQVKIFETFERHLVDDIYIRRKARGIIDDLQKSTVDSIKSECRVVFIAHNLGGILAKRILLLSSEDIQCQWIWFGTLGLYLVESPSSLSHHGWERLLLQLSASNKLPLEALARMLKALPGAIACIELPFLSMFSTFETHLVNPTDPSEPVLPIDRNPWDIRNHTPEMNGVVKGVRALLQKPARRHEKEFQRLQYQLSRYNGALGQISCEAASPEFTNLFDYNGSSYNSWKTDSRSSVLCISSSLGSGKSSLSSQILYLLQMQRTDALFLSFSFNSWDIQRSTEWSFLSSMVRQLLVSTPLSCLRTGWLREMVSQEPYISCQRLWAMFYHLLSGLTQSSLFIILDAVDQCKQHITQMIGHIVTIKRKSPIKILMASSSTAEVPPSVATYSLDLENPETEAAIRKIVMARISGLAILKPAWRDSQNILVQKLCSGQHTFLGITLHLDFLERSSMPSTRYALRNYLSWIDTPDMSPISSIDATFDKMVQSLDGCEAAKEAVNWIYYAVRPLSTSELAIALTLRSSSSSIRQDENTALNFISDRVSGDIMGDLGIAFGIITRVINDKLYLVHGEFRRYLESRHPFLVSNFHTLITRQCLLYLELCSHLESKGSSGVETSEVVSVWALYDYARRYWHEHYKLAGEQSQELDKMVERFLSSTARVLEQPAKDSSENPNLKEPLYDDPLYFAVCFGLVRVVKNILDDGANKDVVRVDDATILAAGTGNIDLLNQLLPFSTPSCLLPAVRVAAKHGHADLISLLRPRLQALVVETENTDLEPSADDPLILAVINGHIAAVEVLLSENFGLQNVSKSISMAVHKASRLGDARMLRLLQKHREKDFTAAMSIQDPDGMTPLQLSCLAGVLDAFDLIKSCSSNNQSHVSGREAIPLIYVAAKSASFDIIERLIESGIDIEEEYSGNTPLSLAAGEGHYDVVRRLIEEIEKRDPLTAPLMSNATSETEQSSTSSAQPQHKSLKNALSEAVRCQHTDVVKLLAPRVKGDPVYNDNVIFLAVEGGDVKIIEALAEADICVRPDDITCIRIIDIAVRENHVEIVHHFVEKGISYYWDGTETSIHYAARLNHDFCLCEMLRKASEDTVRRKTADSASDTALDMAARHGNLEAFKELWAWEERFPILERVPPLPKTLLVAIESCNINLVSYIIEEKNWYERKLDNEQNSPFHIAVAKHDDDKIVRLLLGSHRGDINVRNKSLETALSIACRQGKDGMAQILLENEADPSLANDKGLTPLHYATDSTKITSLLLHLEPTPDLEAVTKEDCRTPLILAASKGHAEVVRDLLQAGANPHAKDTNGWTAIHHAMGADFENIEALRYLRRYGADPNCVDEAGRTPLYIAIRNSNTKSALYILEDEKADLDPTGHAAVSSAKPDSYGGAFRSPLQAAIVHEDFEVAKQLLHLKCKHNAEGGAFGSALHAAIWKDTPDLFRLLMDQNRVPDDKIDVNLRVPPLGTPLHAVYGSTWQRAQPSLQMGKCLVERGADLNARDYSGRTVLMLAICRRPDEETRELLNFESEHKVDVDARDSMGATALHYAAAYYSMNIVQYLLSAGANPSLRDNCGRGALYFAATRSTNDRFNAILEKLSPEDQPQHLAEALQQSLKSDTMDMFESIIQHDGLDVNRTDRNGWTAVDVARQYELSSQLDILESKGGKESSKKLQPTAWCLHDRDDYTAVSIDGKTAWMDPFGLEEVPESIFSTVRANHCIPPDEVVFYFEVTVLAAESALAIGITTEAAPLDSMIGWNDGSWGYHSDDGNMISGNEAIANGLTYKAKQTVGVAVDRQKKEVIFTLDGKRSGRGSLGAGRQLYPAVSFERGFDDETRVVVNFGPHRGGGDFKFSYTCSSASSSGSESD